MSVEDLHIELVVQAAQMAGRLADRFDRMAEPRGLIERSMIAIDVWLHNRASQQYRLSMYSLLETVHNQPRIRALRRPAQEVHFVEPGFDDLRAAYS